MFSEFGTDNVSIILVCDLGQEDLFFSSLLLDRPGAFARDVFLEKVQEGSCKVDAGVTIPSSHPVLLDKVGYVHGLPFL